MPRCFLILMVSLSMVGAVARGASAADRLEPRIELAQSGDNEKPSSPMKAGSRNANKADGVAGKTVAKSDDSRPESSAESEKRATSTKGAAKAAKGGTKGPAPGKLLGPKVTPEREAAVLAFVSQHHPELRELLIHLKESQPREYEAAIRELFRTSERLAQVHERDEERYESELQAWKLQSRVQLLSARLKMQDSPEVRRELERTLHEQIDAQLELVRRERERLAARLEKLDRQIEQMETKRAESIQRHLTLLREPPNGSPKRSAESGQGASGKARPAKSDRP